MLPNYYDILGIPFDSTKSDIKSRYRQLAKKYHPDKNDSPDATSKMQTIQEAKYILYDDEARKRYDIQYAILYGLKSDPNQQQNTNSAEQKRYEYDDPILDKWILNAKRQAADFVKDFYNNTKGITISGCSYYFKALLICIAILILIRIFLIII